MDVFKVTEEFNWVRKVLSSSTNSNHIVVSLKLFNNFLNKWRFEMSEDTKIKLSNDFRVNFEEQNKKVKKMML